MDYGHDQELNKVLSSSSLSTNNNVDGGRGHSLLVSLNKEASVKDLSMDSNCDHHDKLKKTETSSFDSVITEQFEKLCLDDFYDPIHPSTFLYKVAKLYENIKTTAGTIMVDKEEVGDDKGEEDGVTCIRMEDLPEDVLVRHGSCDSEMTELLEKLSLVDFYDPHYSSNLSPQSYKTL
ncbi:unnamed protein product [Dovyalis caffra]|uniref:Uncharacterized protein n=1 Tax=Dovyalis caffra TaxID=77055 RepID=A0AAV1QTK0_9ROSI|nr:unnamed protein product [Dovyalis caffra]